MHPGDLPRRLRTRPAWGSALVALVLRTALVAHALDANPLVRQPILDARYYLDWAGQIAAGDLLGREGLHAGQPFFLNPLYAYVLAPFAALLADPLRAILFAQAALGAATAGLAAATATRSFGRAAGWTAGLLTAFAAPLAQLDAHVAVAELAAFLVAGACFASAPPSPGDRKWAHGPVAAGLWLGIGALARPVTLFALPFVALRYALGAERRWRGPAVVVLAFAACAVPSLARNWIVSGEPVLFTSTGGINVYISNNEWARRWRTMAAKTIRFDPLTMQENARATVRAAVGHEPASSEMSSWFLDETRREFAAAPGETLVFAVHKLRWFLSPVEVPSSASLNVDRHYAPRLAWAFVPVWLIGALAAAGVWAQRKRRIEILGAGGLVAGHLILLTLVFPLSHYRAPAVPALAALAGGAVAAIAAATVAARSPGATAMRLAAIAAAAAIAGAVGPQPDRALARDACHMARTELDRGDFAAAETHARDGIAAFREEYGRAEDHPDSHRLLAQILLTQGPARAAEALAAADRAVAVEPFHPGGLYWRSVARQLTGDLPGAEADARLLVEVDGANAVAHARLGEVLVLVPAKLAEARRELQIALEGGARPDAGALRRAGLPLPR